MLCQRWRKIWLHPFWLVYISLNQPQSSWKVLSPACRNRWIHNGGHIVVVFILISGVCLESTFHTCAKLFSGLSKRSERTNKSVHTLKKRYADVRTEPTLTPADNEIYSKHKLADPRTLGCETYNFGFIPTVYIW